MSRRAPALPSPLMPPTETDPLALLRARFTSAVKAAFPSLANEDIDPLITAGKQPELGDYQSNVAMGLAKRVGKPPRDVAKALVAHVDATGDLLEPLTDASIAGPGFINIKLSAPGPRLHARRSYGFPLPGRHAGNTYADHRRRPHGREPRQADARRAPPQPHHRRRHRPHAGAARPHRRPPEPRGRLGPEHRDGDRPPDARDQPGSHEPGNPHPRRARPGLCGGAGRVPARPRGARGRPPLRAGPQGGGGAGGPGGRGDRGVYPRPPDAHQPPEEGPRNLRRLAEDLPGDDEGVPGRVQDAQRQRHRRAHRGRVDLRG